MLTVITPSGGRQEALSLLNKYLERQTDQDFKWIILDDVDPHGHMPSRCDEYIIAEWTWSGKTTQSKSMVRLLEEVAPDDKVIVCEDDDWYAPNHLEWMNSRLDDYDIVGQRNTIYYNINNRTHRHFIKDDHACMCQTGFTRGAIDHFRQTCKDNPDNIGLDVLSWRNYTGSKLISPDRTVLGIKGLKGRGGIGMGHSMKGAGDHNGEYLRSLIGADANNYL